MTRKDYVLIAEAIRRTRPAVKENPDGTITPRQLQWNTTRVFIMDALQDDNPKFSRTKFIAYTDKE